MDTSSQTSRWAIPLTQLPGLREALQTDAEQIEARRAQRKLVKTICSLPEVRVLPPEQFFVAFKDALANVANELNIPRGRERDEVLSRLLSLSIEEFFQDASAADIQPLSDSIRRWINRKRPIGRSQKPGDEECRGIR
jgi:hypothetical protein